MAVCWDAVSANQLECELHEKLCGDTYSFSLLTCCGAMTAAPNRSASSLIEAMCSLRTNLAAKWAAAAATINKHGRNLRP